MKTAGIIILNAGLLMTLYTVFTYIPKSWQPYVGIGVMVIGGAFLMLGRKKSLTT